MDNRHAEGIAHTGVGWRAPGNRHEGERWPGRRIFTLLMGNLLKPTLLLGIKEWQLFRKLSNEKRRYLITLGKNKKWHKKGHVIITQHAMWLNKE